MSGRDGHARTLWCLWGALLGAMPCVLRSPVVSLFSVSALVAPLQFQVEPLAVALSAVVLVEVLSEGRTSKRFARVLRMVCPVVACVTVPLIALSEAAWLPMRLGDYSLLAWQPVFDPVGNVALTLSLVGWVLFGTCLGDAFAPSGVMERRSLMLGLLLGGVCVPMLLFVVSLGLPAWGGPVLCVASGILSWCVCRQISLTLGGITGSLSCSVVLSGALYTSSVLCKALSEVLLYHPVNFPDADPLGSACIVMLGVASVALVLCVAAAYVRKRWCTGEDLSSHVQPHEAAACDLLPLLPGGDSLSARQRDVIALRLKGMKGAEVAKKLGIGRGTVSTFQRRALDALGFESLDQLSSYLEGLRNNGDAGGELTASVERGRLPHLALPLILLCLTPFASVAPSPFQESGLLAAGALLVIVASAQMIAHDEGTWGCDHVGAGGRARALTCVSAQLLGCFVAVNYGGFPWGWVGIVVAEVLLALVALREGVWCRHVSLEGLRTPWRDLGACLLQGARSVVADRHAFLLLVGSGMSSWRVALLSIELQEAYFIGTVLCIAFVVMDLGVCLRREGQDHTNVSLNGDEGALGHFETLGLSETEARVVVLSARGMTRSQISRRLFIAPGAVNSAKATAYRKLGIHSAREASELLRKRTG